MMSVSEEYDVIIVGAGPVGLLLTNLLVKQGMSVALVEQRTQLPQHSMAIGITPPSLEILHEAGLVQPFIQEGVAVRDVKVFDDNGCLGRLSFESIDSDFPFVLSIPQNMTMSYLEETLHDLEQVTWFEGARFLSFRDDGQYVIVRVENCETGQAGELQGRFLVGCDGTKSQVRACLGIAQVSHRYRPTFIMGEFTDKTGLGQQARLYFTESGSLESFPLPAGRRRWITMIPPDHEDQVSYLIERVETLSGFKLVTADCGWASPFQPVRRLCRTYGLGRVALCGDAAHVMSPIGGQGMNTGFADASLLAELLRGALQNDQMIEEEWSAYSRVRKRAFRISANRAALGMWVGTRKGLAGCIRSILLKRFLGCSWIQHWLASVFSMTGLPGSQPVRDHSLMPLKHEAGINLKSAFKSSEEKRKVNRRIFATIAAEYGWVTRVLSLGRDAAWKQRLIASLPSLREPVGVDLACGNGDLTALLLQQYHGGAFTAIDLSPAMLQQARQTIDDPRVVFREGDMLQTGIESASCDVVTGGYALRNAPDLERAIQEVTRILKPGGWCAVLDFSRSPNRVVSWLQLALLWFWGGLWGLVLHRDVNVYGYIAASLRHYPDRRQLRRLLEKHGLQVVRVRHGLGGMVESLVLQKMERSS